MSFAFAAKPFIQNQISSMVAEWEQGTVRDIIEAFS